MGITAKLVGCIYALGREVDRRTTLRRYLRQPVVSVGNIAVGGRAKTPMIIEIIWGLLQRNFDPVILTRGYKREHKGPVFLDREKIHFIDTGKTFSLSELQSDEILEAVGDEALEIFVKTGAKILVGSKRHDNAMWFLSSRGGSSTDLVFLMDDGFQHWKLARDLDVVMYKAEDLEDDLLPLGRLREKPSALKRADIAIALGDDCEKRTLFPTDEMSGEAAVFVTRAPDKEYRSLVENHFGGCKYVKLKDHASKASLLRAIHKTDVHNIVVGYKEAVKLVPWKILATHEGRPFVRDDLVDGKRLWVLGLRLKFSDSGVLWTRLDHMLDMKYSGDEV